MKRANSIFIPIFIFALILACFPGCSSSGSSSGSSGADSGVFIDSPVQGLTYETATQSGTTDAAGTFQYQDGETVKFFIGNLLVGESTAKSILTPINLVPGASDAEDSTVTNICRLLQSLDADGNPDNGITITEAIADEVDDYSIDFTQSIQDFGSSTDIQDLFDALNALGVFSEEATGTLLSAEEAQEHLEEAITIIESVLPGSLTNYASGTYSYNPGTRILSFTFTSSDFAAAARKQAIPGS